MNDDLLSCLPARRQVSLRRLLQPGPDSRALQSILAAAAHAPDHGCVQPWRFILIPANRRPELGCVFAEALVSRDPGCSGEARAQAFDKAFHAPCLLVAVLADAPGQSSIPRHEKLVSLGCALQNLLIAAQVLRFDTGLASGGSMDDPGMRRLLGLAPHELAVCFIGIGSAGQPGRSRERPDPASYFSSL